MSGEVETNCPRCGEVIEDIKIVCQHCGWDMDDEKGFITDGELAVMETYLQYGEVLFLKSADRSHYECMKIYYRNLINEVRRYKKIMRRNHLFEPIFKEKKP